MNIKPLHDRVIVKRVEIATKSEGGVDLIAEHQKKPQIGTVIAVGPGRIENCDTQQMAVKEGDRVFLPVNIINPFECKGCNYEMMREDDILGVIQ